jgi:lysophospholipase L1-like esterase
VWHPELDNPHYEQFVPVVADHCQGTHHQDIRGVERVVFLGDSITAGTPPTLPNQLYRMRLEQRLREAFGQDITVDNCSRIGARSSDFFDGNTPQLAPCFPYPEDARVTLTIMTMGGNNMADLQRVGQDGAPLEETMGRANLYLDEMDRALGFLKDPQRFPNGSFVVFSNLYEFTDGTGDVASCASARLAGLTGVWNDGPQVLIHVNEQLMRLAVQHRADMLFTLEHFCGHGFHNNDPGARCYRGPDTPRWFDLTCIHPTPTGHGVLADMFAQTILAAP